MENPLGRILVESNSRLFNKMLLIQSNIICTAFYNDNETPSPLAIENRIRTSKYIRALKDEIEKELNTIRQNI